MTTRSLLLLALLISGCGSASDSLLEPAQAQTGSQLEGTWGGYFGSSRGDGIELELTQSGTSIEGHGAVFREDNPQPIFVVGLVDSEGVFELDLFPVDVAVTQSMTLMGKLSGGTISASFAVDDAPTGTPITLSQSTSTPPGPGNSFTLQFRANADGRGYSVEVNQGQWRSDGAFGTLTSGTATSGTIPFFENWAQLDLHPQTAGTFNNVAHFLFPRQGGTRALDPDSGVMLAGRSRSYVVGTIGD